jgi:hypothetical protein
MSFKTLDELRRPDDRSLAFTPIGLGVGVQMRPDAAAEYQQHVMAQLDLDPRVADGTRRRFEDLRTAFVTGLWQYAVYTVVRDQALLMFEEALGDRFVEFHQGAVTFVDAANVDHVVEVSRYGHVKEFLRSRRPGCRRPRHRVGWRLRLPDGRVIPFAKGMLGDLRVWARDVGLLRGQRNRGIEKALSDLRNAVAHPGSYHLTGPEDAACTLRDLAEIINQLWGVPTPGGRLYPTPLRRHVFAMAWPVGGDDMQIALAADALTDCQDPEDRPWECVLVRAVLDQEQHRSEPELRYYDSRAELTRYPTDLLWGPGTVTDAAAWFTQHQPQSDECDYLDRTFMIRHHGTDLYQPMRPAVAAALPERDRTGTWYTVRADHPSEAWHHIRNLLTGPGCQQNGPCRQCHAEGLGSGPYHTAVVYAELGADPAPALPNDVRTPWAPPRAQRVQLRR